MTPSRFEPAGRLRGTIRPPPDKSISHRAALIGAMGGDEVAISGYLNAADTRSTLAAVEAVGGEVEVLREEGRALHLLIRGTEEPRGAEIDVGNAGTLLRLMPGWLAGHPPESWVLDGDDSIRRRPVDRVAEPLRLMGASVECRDGRLPPLRLHGEALTGIHYELPVASAQVKSCVLLAGLFAAGETTVSEPAPSRDHTERMLKAAGAPIRTENGGVAIAGSRDPGLLEWIEIPGDFSSAAFVIAAALLVPDSEVRLSEVGLNPTRTGLLSILGRMGARIDVEFEREEGGEPIGGIRALYAPLRGTEVGGDEVPLAIDELPLVTLAACFAEGETVIRDAAELRVKESDRIGTVVEGLRGLGAEIEATEDGMVVTGTGGLRGGRLQAHGDHRLAMMGAVAGLASREGVEVEGIDAAEVSYPGFEQDLRALTS